MDRNEGLLFDRYEFLRLLGEGGQAEVWEVKQRGLGGFTKHIALKVVRADAERPLDAQRRLIAEARIAAEIHHPHVVEIYDVGEIKERVYIAMELVRGVDLECLINAHLLHKKRPLPWPLAARLIADTCKGLHCAHTFTDKENQPRFLIHRDLKLKNLVLDRNGYVKIIDFGIARASQISPTTHTIKLRGTPAFMSPEQIRNLPIDPRSDLFSLGVVFYALVCGALPFLTHDVFSTLFQIVSQEPILPREKNPDIPPELEAILLRLLAKEPQARFDSARAVQRAIDDLLQQHQQRLDYEDIAAFLRDIPPEILALANQPPKAEEPDTVSPRIIDLGSELSLTSHTQPLAISEQALQSFKAQLTLSFEELHAQGMRSPSLLTQTPIPLDADSTPPPQEADQVVAKLAFSDEENTSSLASPPPSPLISSENTDDLRDDPSDEYTQNDILIANKPPYEAEQTAFDLDAAPSDAEEIDSETFIQHTPHTQDGSPPSTSPFFLPADAVEMHERDTHSAQHLFADPSLPLPPPSFSSLEDPPTTVDAKVLSADEGVLVRPREPLDTEKAKKKQRSSTKEHTMQLSPEEAEAWREKKENARKEEEVSPSNKNEKREEKKSYIKRSSAFSSPKHQEDAAQPTKAKEESEAERQRRKELSLKTTLLFEERPPPLRDPKKQTDEIPIFKKTLSPLVSLILGMGVGLIFLLIALLFLMHWYG